SKLPVHQLADPNTSIVVRKIAHKNPYDFTKKHRHNYFEIIFFKRGGGSQLIDFVEYPVKEYGCYIIHPNQVHLLKRAQESCGHLIQFKAEALTAPGLSLLLKQCLWQDLGAIVFEEKQEVMEQLIQYLHLIDRQATSSNPLAKQAAHNLLQAFLFELLMHQSLLEVSDTADQEFATFSRLIETNYKTEHTVKFYLAVGCISEKKLGQLTKQHLGLSPLQVIHARVLLEAKRLLTFGEQSHKEIAFDLGFDSPASFSAFIKKKTGKTASELQTEVNEIHTS
ncbi:MAG: AraC family transcriptional activator of pobA, partial [Litorivivens sp.]